MKIITKIRMLIFALFVACVYLFGYYLAREYDLAKQNITVLIDKKLVESVDQELEKREPNIYYSAVRKPYENEKIDLKGLKGMSLERKVLNTYQTLTKDNIIDVIYLDSIFSSSLNKDSTAIKTALTVKYIETIDLISSSDDKSFYKAANYVSTITVGMLNEIEINAYVHFPLGYIFKSLHFSALFVTVSLFVFLMLILLFVITFFFNKDKKNVSNDIGKKPEAELNLAIANPPIIELDSVSDPEPVVNMLDRDNPIRKLEDGNYVLGELILDGSKRCLFRGTEEIKLKQQEFDILKTFIEQGDETLFVPRNIFTDKLWSNNYNCEDNLNTAMKRLRETLDEIDSNLEIITERKLGYILRYNT